MIFIRFFTIGAPDAENRKRKYALHCLKTSISRTSSAAGKNNCSGGKRGANFPMSRCPCSKACRSSSVAGSEAGGRSPVLLIENRAGISLRLLKHHTCRANAVPDRRPSAMCLRRPDVPSFGIDQPALYRPGTGKIVPAE